MDREWERDEWMEETEGCHERLRAEMQRVSAEGASSCSLMKLRISDRFWGIIRKIREYIRSHNHQRGKKDPEDFLGMARVQGLIPLA
jgi:GTP cyclohydrolase II